MYDIQEDASSNHHARLEKSAGSLNPSVVLEDLAMKGCGGL